MKAFSVVFLFSLSTTSLTANAGPLPERVETAAKERIAADSYQTLVFGVVDGDKTEIVTFGKLDNGNAPDGDTVFEIGSITKTFTATLLAQAVLAGRVTLDTSVSQLLARLQNPVTRWHGDNPRRTRHPALGLAADAHQHIAQGPGQSLRRL